MKAGFRGPAITNFILVLFNFQQRASHITADNKSKIKLNKDSLQHDVHSQTTLSGPIDFDHVYTGDLVCSTVENNNKQTQTLIMFDY